ncbi:MAG: plasmid recombination protein [Limnobacter sp.]|uniref:plasmid recombination protein n=1 Tax=Limnobacter sp. TaxID=2003368 RepID=UPI0022CADB47|nr:plasmid recombination protein [Limnobacter sp.]MCZ8017153.1 plasmid recombination protein [Limnobacter sp.]MCZ8081495.1 plasmid recombination protein [Paracoccaceae bacterium]
MGKYFIALRVRPLKKWADVAAATEHGQRIRNVAHVDLTRTDLNVHWSYDPAAGGLVPIDSPADIAACLRKRANQIGARWHKTAIVSTEVMFIASPEFFLTEGGATDPARARRWAEACMEAWEGLFPGQSVAARLDLDETAPHFSVFFLPLHERQYRSSARVLKKPKATNLKVSHNKTFGEAKGPEILSMLQSWIADEMQIAGFDLHRGLRVDETGATNKTPAAGRRTVEAARQLAAEIEELARQEAVSSRASAEQEIGQRLVEVHDQIDVARGKIVSARARNREQAEAIKEAWAEIERERAEVRQASDDLLKRIQVLDKVMHQIARDLEVEVTGSFWKRLKAISDAIEDRRNGGGPAYRPG